MSSSSSRLAGHKAPDPYRPKHKIRVVTAASLFDGHDAAINIMRRILQATGCEVIHLGHDRSVGEVVNAAIQEDVQAIAITSYQGGHSEYFRYMYDLLSEKGASHIKIFGGGGGVILPEEIHSLMEYGIARIYSPDDGRAMGLQGMINDVVQQSDWPTGKNIPKTILDHLTPSNTLGIAQLISAAENFYSDHTAVFEEVSRRAESSTTPVLGITGTGGAGKSTIVDELVRRFLHDFRDKTVGIISVDPSKRKTGGALLGDRIRMNSINDPRVYMRSLATRQSNLAISAHVKESLQVLKAASFDLIILETSGIGQGDTEILDYSDVSLYVMTPEYGAATQLEKIDMLDYADIVVLNKFDKRGAQDALRDVKKQYQRGHQRFQESPDDMPVFGTIASQFNDPGTNGLYRHVITTLNEKTKADLRSSYAPDEEQSEKVYIIPPGRTRYLSEIAEVSRHYDTWVAEQSALARQIQSVQQTLEHISSKGDHELATRLEPILNELKAHLAPGLLEMLERWPEKAARYREPVFTFVVRGRELSIQTYSTSLSQTQVPKIAVPRYDGWGDLLKWLLRENVPGEFPYTAGIYPFKRETEDPTRMFAGEGGPERTNRRFHYVSKDMPARRLSTAFDSVTLYGHDPDYRPDIYGKIGNSGVSVCCLDDAKRLYSGFNLADPATSVSMTINGPAPMLLGFFFNTAIDQQCELYIRQAGKEAAVRKKIEDVYKARGLEPPSYRGNLPEGNDGLGLLLLGVTGDEVLDRDVYEKIKADTLSKVRGTVQADILKEDQAQNTCIFSTEFALRLMGDVQQYFIDRNVRNFYSVSISGYHIAEAGANPITQLAFTLANGFTYVEYYLSRGMHIDSFAPNLSFFFSNGIDPEYAVIGRVARRIWAKAIREKYHGNARSQMLKYHIQTSGRSLHAQEIDFNDIRTTLQALYAIYDNCNSLHTNAYDEAITTPTEESVRRAMAIQLIINRELGLAKNENPLQGSFIIEELTDLVEEAVLSEFDRITERGGVL
ncbi:MAG TPA: methylmalonyl-CoA mutase family protein, partial [Cyclobacteriaceae bacterium]